MSKTVRASSAACAGWSASAASRGRAPRGYLKTARQSIDRFRWYRRVGYSAVGNRSPALPHPRPPYPRRSEWHRRCPSRRFRIWPDRNRPPVRAMPRRRAWLKLRLLSQVVRGAPFRGLYRAARFSSRPRTIRRYRCRRSAWAPSCGPGGPDDGELTLRAGLKAAQARSLIQGTLGEAGPGGGRPSFRDGEQRDVVAIRGVALEVQAARRLGDNGEYLAMPRGLRSGAGYPRVPLASRSCDQSRLSACRSTMGMRAWVVRHGW